MKDYIKNNYWRGIKTSPLNAWKVSTLVALPFFAFAMGWGFYTGLLKYDVLESNLFWVLPVALFIFPSFLEESFFRGILIPNNARERGAGYIITITLVTAIIFVLWHPLNVLTINPGAKAVFTDPNFLLMAFVRGIACAISYIYSRSLWAPVIIHWLTVLVWVLFLGGRNLVLE